MKKIRFIFRLFSTVTVCVVISVALFTTVINPEDSLSPAILWQILLVSWLCSMGSLVYPWKRTPGKTEMGIRVLLHYLLVNVIVLGAGLWFGWYRIDHLWSVLSMVICIAAVFAAVSAIELTKASREAKQMNEKLKEYKAQEQDPCSINSFEKSGLE